MNECIRASQMYCSAGNEKKKKNETLEYQCIICFPRNLMLYKGLQLCDILRHYNRVNNLYFLPSTLGIPVEI